MGNKKNVESKVLESGIWNQVKRHWYKIDSKLKE